VLLSAHAPCRNARFKHLLQASASYTTTLTWLNQTSLLLDSEQCLPSHIVQHILPFRRYKKAFEYAGYSVNGQVTHRSRHDGAVTGRLQLDASTQSVGDMGDWQQTVLTEVYARLPRGTDLAKFAEFGSRDHYSAVEGLLDPSIMPEFKGMVQALCAN